MSCHVDGGSVVLQQSQHTTMRRSLNATILESLHEKACHERCLGLRRTCRSQSQRSSRQRKGIELRSRSAYSGGRVGIPAGDAST